MALFLDVDASIYNKQDSKVLREKTGEVTTMKAYRRNKETARWIVSGVTLVVILFTLNELTKSTKLFGRPKAYNFFFVKNLNLLWTSLFSQIRIYITQVLCVSF
jgi:hypothetical protein